MCILVQFMYYYSNSRISSALSICYLFFFYELFGNIYMEQDTVSPVVKYYSQSWQNYLKGYINFNSFQIFSSFSVPLPLIQKSIGVASPLGPIHYHCYGPQW